MWERVRQKRRTVVEVREVERVFARVSRSISTKMAVAQDPLAAPEYNSLSSLTLSFIFLLFGFLLSVSYILPRSFSFPSFVFLAAIALYRHSHLPQCPLSRFLSTLGSLSVPSKTLIRESSHSPFTFHLFLLPPLFTSAIPRHRFLPFLSAPFGVPLSRYQGTSMYILRFTWVLFHSLPCIYTSV